MADGGLYVIEDVFVTPTPWEGWDTPENRIPNSNNVSRCGKECYLLQRPAEHPFLTDQSPRMKAALADRDWWFAVTGASGQGGGLDVMMVIVK